jgi:hypothetical protein
VGDLLIPNTTDVFADNHLSVTPVAPAAQLNHDVNQDGRRSAAA